MKKSELPELVTLSRNIRAARQAAGLSQQALADQAGLHRTYLAGLEQGLGNPSLEKMASLSTCLGTTVIDLLTPLKLNDPKANKTADSDATLKSVVDLLRESGAIK